MTLTFPINASDAAAKIGSESITDQENLSGLRHRPLFTVSGPGVTFKCERPADELWKCRGCGKRQKNVASLSRLEKSGKEQPDFPTFPQLLLLDSYKNVKNQNRTFEGVDINHKTD